MPNKKEKRIHEIIKQARRPLCMALVLAIVFIYGYVVSAEGASDFDARFSTELTNMTDLLYGGGMLSNYSANGGDISKLPGSPSSNSSGIMSSNYLTSLSSANNFMNNFKTFFSSYQYPTSFTYQSVTYDLTNAYTMVASSTWDNTVSARDVFLIMSEGRLAMVNGYFVSDMPIYIYAPNNGNVNQMTIYSQTTVSDNGYYCYLAQNIPANGAFTNSYPKKLLFTDLDVFYASTDGFSGFESFSTTSTDFDFADTSDYYNFNYLKTGGIIIAPADPVPEPVSNKLGANYNYCNISAYFRGNTSSSIVAEYNFIGMNNYMRSHPEEYEVELTYRAKVLTQGNVPPTITQKEFSMTKKYALRNLVGYGHNQVASADSFSDRIDFNAMTSDDPNNLMTLYDCLMSFWEYYSGANGTYYQEDSVVTFDDIFAQVGLSGSYSKNPNIVSLEDIYFYGQIKINWIGGQPEVSSGTYSWYDYLLETQVGEVINNDIGTNYNPPESYDPQYPATLTGNGGISTGSGTGSGSGGTTWNVVSNDIKAQVEYLYNLDVSDFNNIAGNSTSALQSAINFVTSSDQQHGFGAILTRSYGLIPDEITDWIKATVGVLLGGAILGWVYNGVRIKRG